MRKAALLTALTVVMIPTVQAQWQIQDAHTTADLRGIDAVGNGVAWASGTNGTVLRTEDSGFVWQLCATPPGAEKLDFRGIQAFDNNAAIVMSSGKGDLSRLYKTTDGCQTWKLVFRNNDAPDGLFDALLFLNPSYGLVLGDPTPSQRGTPGSYHGSFRLAVTTDGGLTWGGVVDTHRQRSVSGLRALDGESAFAASNSILASNDKWLWFATSASRISRVPTQPFTCSFITGPLNKDSACGPQWEHFENYTARVRHGSESAGVFSLFFATAKLGVAVGGDYASPSDARETASFTRDEGVTWLPSTTFPHGYRSAVAYDKPHNTWITVGPNGTDISTDDGRNWRALKPDPKFNDAPDADQHWNALSLPFVVGPHGRVGVLRPDTLKSATP